MKKFITVALSTLLILGTVGCAQRNTNTTGTNGNTTGTNDNTTEQSNAYYNSYTGLYNESIGTLTGYDMYTDVNTANDAFKNKEYPGNEQYLNDVKPAYKDSREKIQSFVNGLKNDVKTDDAELKQMNEDLIAEGEKLIKDIDAKIAKLDKITENDYNKTQNEFIQLVNDTVNTGENVASGFSEMLRNMDVRLGINRDTINKNNTNNTTK